ncbi:hypothetical protein HDE_04887 [Halotydeus destructor]|nr:hypothetical protein HDE_04887 [Halotydeus destructor]
MSSTKELSSQMLKLRLGPNKFHKQASAVQFKLRRKQAVDHRSSIRDSRIHSLRFGTNSSESEELSELSEDEEEHLDEISRNLAIIRNNLLGQHCKLRNKSLRQLHSLLRQEQIAQDATDLVPTLFDIIQHGVSKDIRITALNCLFHYMDVDYVLSRNQVTLLLTLMCDQHVDIDLLVKVVSVLATACAISSNAHIALVSGALSVIKSCLGFIITNNQQSTELDVILLNLTRISGDLSECLLEDHHVSDLRYLFATFFSSHLDYPMEATLDSLVNLINNHPSVCHDLVAEGWPQQIITYLDKRPCTSGFKILARFIASGYTYLAQQLQQALNLDFRFLDINRSAFSNLSLSEMMHLDLGVVLADYMATSNMAAFTLMCQLIELTTEADIILYLDYLVASLSHILTFHDRFANVQSIKLIRLLFDKLQQYNYPLIKARLKKSGALDRIEQLWYRHDVELYLQTKVVLRYFPEENFDPEEPLTPDATVNLSCYDPNRTVFQF